MTTKEVIIDVLKEMILPELGEIKGNYKEVSLRLDNVEKQISFMNQHLVDQSRRIDETNKRIDGVILVMGEMKKEMERIKRESAITGDILHRLEILEERVLLSA